MNNTVILKTNIERYLEYSRLYLQKVFVILLILGPLQAMAQPWVASPDLSDRIRYMIKDSSLVRQIEVRQNGVCLFACDENGHVSSQPEIMIYEGEWSLLGLYFTDVPLVEALAYYQAKQTQRNFMDLFQHLKGVHLSTEPRKLPLSHLKVALDPGHFAHNFATAKLEKKFVRLRGKDMGRHHDIELYEARLTALTAMILKDMLTELGAEVLVTRDEHTSATGKNFDDWYAHDFQHDLKMDLDLGLITEAEYKEYSAHHEHADEHKKKILRTYFKDREFRCRAEKINAFRPHLTLILHYNVGENNNPDAEGYHTPHDRNFSMVFVGGAYTRGELVKPVDRMHFLRQLMTDDIEHSLEFSAIVARHIETEMQVPLYTGGEMVLPYIRDYSIAADQEKYKGVYHRNLALTRSIYGVMAFAEPLLQDNREEALKLSTSDCEWKGHKVPCRLIEMAQAYKNAVVEYYTSVK